MTNMSACRACGIEKSADDFYPRDRTCKACRIAYQLARYYAGAEPLAKLVNVLTSGDAQPFWRRVEKTFACWFWRGATNAKGYGIANLRDGQIGAHRIAWILTNGPIADGLFVLHRCDNPPCVRPDHLFLGTTQDNTADCVRKGRSRRMGRGVGRYQWTSETASAAAKKQYLSAITSL